MSQEELGDRAGTHRTQISLIESGSRQPRLGTLVKLAAALEVPIGHLVEGIGWDTYPYPGRWTVVDPPELPRFKQSADEA